MNTYDPADYIVYVSMDRQTGSSVGAAPGRGMEHRLPEGYANASPKTRLRSSVRTFRSDGRSPLEPLAAPAGWGELRARRADGMA